MKLEHKQIKPGVPEGEWPATVMEAEETESQAGKAKLVLVYEIQLPDGKRKLTGHHSLAAQWSTNSLAATFGSLDGPAQMLEGRTCIVKIKHESYEGRTTAKVDRTLPDPDAGTADASTDASSDEGDGGWD